MLPPPTPPPQRTVVVSSGIETGIAKYSHARTHTHTHKLAKNSVIINRTVYIY